MLKRWRMVIGLMMMATWALLAQAESASVAGQGLLWKVEAAGKNPSYLFGTMHSEHIDVVTLAEPVRTAFMACDRVILEMVMDTGTLNALSNTFQITNGPDLPTQVGQPLYRQAVEVMSQQGIPEHVLRTMKPWAAAMTLMVPRSNTGLFLDRVLYLEALAKGKPVSGLETVKEQTEVFDGMTPEDQVMLLAEAVKVFPQLEKLYADMRSAYVKRDLQALVAISDASMKDSDPAFVKRFNERVIHARNQRMAERLQDDIKAGGSFVAVGALHLAGEDGLIASLRKQGYKVTAVY